MVAVMSGTARAHRRPRRRQRGQGLVEFAIAAPVLFILVFGVIDFGRGMSADVTVTNSAREGARTLATTVTLQSAGLTSWTQPAGCAGGTAACLLNMSCPVSVTVSPATGTAQGNAWLQLRNSSLDLTQVTMTAKFYSVALGHDPGSYAGAADQSVTCSDFGVAPTYSSTYVPVTGDWIVFTVKYTYAPTTPVIGSFFKTGISMSQSATMVLE